MKSQIRGFIRRILNLKKNETINSGIERKKINIQKKFYKSKITKEKLKENIQKLGVRAGDNLIVHSSWRQFYNFLGTPQDVIEVLKEILGEDGTLIMPSYGENIRYFDVNKSKSNAGVITEIFRKLPGTLRSHCTHFSMSAYGKNSKYLTKDHFFSKYGFDKYSPYSKFIKLDNSKILFLGLGKEPTKISLFHCVSAELMENNKYFESLLSNVYNSKLVIEDQEYSKKMITRKSGHSNNNKNFKKIFREIKNKRYQKISNLEMVIIDAKEGFQKAREFAEKGIYCYK
ncbi:AAC(3) family N-acetyltransferase (plasmid) [Cetobacterium somerae]|uniref:AAC(3) family N-acetyltransferase n=1 Tax=Cetobacterium somerae TaxID=188913 RepID=UPI001F06C0D7|nr:AAC(3) family N-acetyltransferase [Cetobacterium somerae]UPO98531.1 AAC(3) family N-acetyltransferase [Cetobacterium somerae]